MANAKCPWVKSDLEETYHDQEWGQPEHDDAKLFEMLILEGMQAGLSWISILKKRENMRAAFDGFDPHLMANYDDQKVEDFMANPDILRNRAKLKALKSNAAAFLRIQAEFGTFDRYLWAFVQGNPIVNQWDDMSQIPAQTPVSETLSKDLKKRGFMFVGPVICYAFMQAIGMVNDHLTSCPQYKLCLKGARP